MKNFEKIVPVLATGLVVAGLGTADAFAAENVDTQAPEATPPAEEQKQETSAPSTEIKSVTQTEPQQTEDGVTKSEGAVNPSVDENNTITDQGTLDITTTPDAEDTDPVTNPDGSTTTTEGSTTEITGEVNGDATTTPSEEEQNKVENDVQDELNKVEDKDKENSYDWNQFGQNIKDKYGENATVSTGTDADGNPTHTFEFSESSNPESKPLSKEELSTALGKDLTPVDGQENTYTYKDGNTTVTVVVKDESTETSTTKWTVTVTEQTKTEDGKVDINTPVVDIKDPDVPEAETPEISVKEILDKVDGTINVKDGVKYVDGNKTYTLTFETSKTEQVDISTLSPEALSALLPAGDGYELKDGKIIQKTENGDVRELNFDSATQTLTVTMYTINMTVAERTEQETTGDSDAANKKAIIDAVTNAVMNAIKEDGLTGQYTEDVKTQVEADDDKDNSWTVKVTVGNKEYTYVVTLDGDLSSENEVWSTEKIASSDIKNLVDGSTTTITGNAYVSGEKVVWSGTSGTTTAIITVENGKGSVNYTEGQQFNGADVKDDSIKYDNNGRITELTTVVTSKDANGNDVVTTKVYTFIYDVSLTTEEKNAILKEQMAEGATLDGLSKITWTIQQTDVTKVPNTGTNDTTNTELKEKGETAITGELPNGVTKDNGKYSYKGTTLEKDNEKSTDETNVYTGKNEQTGEIYTIEETDVPLASSDDIQTLISQKYTVPTGFTFDKIDGTTAIYKNSETGETITVNFSDLTKTNVTLTISSNNQITGSSEEEVAKKIAAWMKSELEKNPNVKFKGFDEITSSMTVEEIQIIIQKKDQAINHTVDFTKMGETELIALLEKLEGDSIAAGNSYVKKPTGENGTQNHYDVWVGNDVQSGTQKAFYGVTYTCIEYNKHTGMSTWQLGSGEWVPGGKKKPGHWTGLSGETYVTDANRYINIPIPEHYTDKNNVKKDYTQNGFHTELGHVDLVADSTLSKTEGSTVSSEDCVILGSGLEVWLNATASGLINNIGSQRAPLSGSIDWDDQDGLEGKGFWQYNRGSDVSQDYLDRTNKFYKVTGTVAYGLTRYDDESDAMDAKGKNGVIDYVKVPRVLDGKVVKDARGDVVYEYVTYTKTAELTTYGYLGAENNACHNDYDIKLGNLTLLKGGQEVTSVNQEVKVYSADITKTTSTSTTTQSLSFGDIVTATPKTGTTDVTVMSSDKGQQIAGNWTITQNKAVTHTTGEDEEQTTDYLYKGTGTGSFDSYKTWKEDTKEYQNAATGTQYGGSLSYTYDMAGDPTIEVTGETTLNRNVDVTLDNTSVTTTPATPTPTPTPTPRPTPTPTPTPTPPPVVDIPEEDPPLVDIPEEEPPLVDIPEEEPPLVDIPEEEPPLVDVPDTQPPKATVTIPAEKVPLVKAPDPSTVEILDEEVPLADVPNTGETPMGLLAAAAACLSGLGLGLLKKRED